MHRELQPNDERPAAKPWSTRNIGRLLADRSHLPARRQRGGVPRSVRFSRPSLVLGRRRDHRQVLYWLDQFDLDAQPLGQQRSILDSLLPVVGHYRGDKSFVAIGLAQDDGERVLPLVMRSCGSSIPLAQALPPLRYCRQPCARTATLVADHFFVSPRIDRYFTGRQMYSGRRHTVVCMLTARAKEAVPASVTSWVRRAAGVGMQQHGRIGKQGRAHARDMLVQAAWVAVCLLRGFLTGIDPARGRARAAHGRMLPATLTA